MDPRVEQAIVAGSEWMHGTRWPPCLPRDFRSDMWARLFDQRKPALASAELSTPHADVNAAVAQNERTHSVRGEMIPRMLYPASWRLRASATRSVVGIIAGSKTRFYVTSLAHRRPHSRRQDGWQLLRGIARFQQPQNFLLLRLRLR